MLIKVKSEREKKKKKKEFLQAMQIAPKGVWHLNSLEGTTDKLLPETSH
jgi:hypothetical protein